MFSATNKVTNSDKGYYMYRGNGMIFESAGSWSFFNDTARIFIIFCVDNRSSYHAENCNNNFLVLGERSNFGINGTFPLL